jgi:15-cis-phytoene synthase
VNALRASEDDYAHCQALVRASDKDRFVATLFAPAEHRPHLFAVYAFNLEIARIGEIAHEPLAGEIRLQWWHDCLSGGDVAGHPVASALLDSIERRNLAIEPLLDLIDARRFDVYNEPIGTLGEFESYVRSTSSALFGMAVRIIDATAAASETADTAGLAYGISALVAAVGAHAARGRVYVPADVLARHGAGPDDVLAGRSSSAVTAALKDLILGAHRQYETFFARAKQMPASARAAFLPVATVPLTLRRLSARQDHAQHVVELSPLRRLQALTRAALLGFAKP